ncbi:MAG: ClbS/DfsB family four-helix bundle protein [Actinomycetota bacterium]|nr:ClbS/DfsB family four-helix bundle protein [Actinomycetota bacterium]MDH5224943.1 ClbS/DfsB family four-helix bundle protein [Actinomycetota bacterium]MDH5313009.1 ClbS/DfsB family four-helix bundle protein [Actinomycetota bacterium]
MATDDRLPTRRRAIRIVDDGMREVFELYDRLPPRARTTPGLGGGDWSPKDLLGHLESWQGYALEALDAWAEGHGPEIDAVIWSTSTSVLNRDAVARKASRSAADQRRRALATHEALLSRLEEFGDARWRRPGTARGRTPAGARLGNLLGGPSGPFRHAEAHLPQLRLVVEEALAGTRRNS